MTTFAKQPIRLLEGKVYIGMDVLVELGVPFTTIKDGYIRNSRIWQKIDDPEDARRVLIAYEPMSEQYKVKVRERYGEPSEFLIASQWLSEQPSIQEIEFFMKHLQHRTDSQRAKIATGYIVVAKVLDKCVRLTTKQCQQLGFNSKEQLLKAVLNVMKVRKNDLPVKMGSLRVLRRRMTDFQRAFDEGGQTAAWLSLLVENRHKSNQNPSKITLKEQENYLLGLMGSPQKPPYPVICSMFNEVALQKKWLTKKGAPLHVCERTIQRFLEQPHIKEQWYQARHGSEAYYQEYDVSAKRRKTSRAHALWVMDGTPLDLYYQETTEQYDELTGRHSKKTSYYNRMYLFAVVDDATWAIIGYVLCDNENHTAVVGALKDAVDKTQVLPKQLQRDNGSAGEMVKNLIDKLVLYHTPAMPYNPKTKSIEAVFGHLQSEVLRYNEEWAAMNITTKKLDSRFNPDEMDKSKFPTKAELIEKVALLIEVWNNYATKKRKAPNQLLAELPSAGRSFGFDTYMDLFWVMPKKTFKYQSDGIKLEVNKKPYWFSTLDSDLRTRLLHQQFQIKYEPEELDTDGAYIYLYQNEKPLLHDGQHVTLGKTEFLAHAIDDYKDGDGKKIAEFMKLKKAIIKKGEENVAKIRKIQAEEGIKLGVKQVHKHAYNAAETALKRSQAKDESHKLRYYTDNPYDD